jgi:hypothetical protein
LFSFASAGALKKGHTLLNSLESNHKADKTQNASLEQEQLVLPSSKLRWRRKWCKLKHDPAQKCKNSLFAPLQDHKEENGLGNQTCHAEYGKDLQSQELNSFVLAQQLVSRTSALLAGWRAQIKKLQTCLD